MKALTYGGIALITLFAASTASSADLGGNCCADLEERVAELEATTARKGNRRVTLEVSGHVNQIVVFSDYDAIDIGGGFSTTGGADGAENGNDPRSSSRFRFKGEGKISADWSAGYLMEIGVSNSDLSTRHNALFMKSKTFGTVWLGRTSDAADGIAQIDLGQSVNVNLDFTLYQSLIGDTLTIGPGGVTVPLSQVVGLASGFDGGRTDLVKWASPTIAGFVASASWAQDDNMALALRYAGEFGAIRVAAGVGYQMRRDQSVSRPVNVELGPLTIPGTASVGIGDSDVLSGSASIMHIPSGLFMTGSAGEIDFKDATSLLGGTLKSRGYAGKVGVRAKVSAMGHTQLSAEYGVIKLSGTAFSVGDSSYYGAEISQEIDAAAAKLSLTYRRIDADYGFFKDETDVIAAGVKIQF